MKKMMWKCTILSLALLAAACGNGVYPGAAQAADLIAGNIDSDPITYKISEDMNLTVTSSYDRAVVADNAREVITVEEGKAPVLVIKNATEGGIDLMQYMVLAEFSGKIDLASLDKLEINGPARAAVFAQENSDITIGDHFKAVISTDEAANVQMGRPGETGVVARAGIYASGDVSKSWGPASVTIGNDADLTSDYNVLETYTNGTVTVGDNAKLTSINGYGARADEKGVISIGDNLVIRAEGNDGIYEYGANQEGLVGGMGLVTEDHGKISVGESADIKTLNNTLYAYDNGTIDIGKDAVMESTGGAGASATFSGSAHVGENARINAFHSGVLADADGNVTVDKGAEITTQTGDGAVAARGNGTVELSDARISAPDGMLALNAAVSTPEMQQRLKDKKGVTGPAQAGTITANGLYDINGGLYAEENGKIDLTMQDGSKLKGASAIAGDAAAINVSMDHSQWEMTDNSKVTSLNLANDSNVNYVAQPLTTLETQTLSGSGGTFAMKSDIATETADKLLVTKSAEGDYKLDVTDQGSANTTGKERTILVETADKNGSFALTNGTVEAGAWKYSLRNVSDDERGQLFSAGGDAGQIWELYADAPSDPGEGGTDSFMGTYYLNYAETDTLMKRLGDLRGDAEHGGWFRGFGGNMDSDAREFAGAFDMDYWGMQVGYDNKLDRDKSWFKNGDTYVGGFVGVSNGDLDFGQNGGTGDLENHTMGMYATYIGDNGFYVDSIAKYVWSKNEFTAHDSAGSLVQGGKINTGGVGLSLEMGKRIRFKNESKKDGNWYIEPQVQLSWQHMGGDTFHASNGLDIGVDDFNSLIGRVGALVGYESKNTNIYVKASYLKEFDGDMDVHGNDAIMSDSLEGSWWVYGIGITRKMNDRNSLYFDLERASGDEFDQDWNINAGWRISF